MFIHRVIETLERHKLSYALAGGFAVALHGAVRGTIDVDIVITMDKNSFRNTELALKEIGLQPRLPINADDVFLNREEYISNRNLIAWSFVNPLSPVECVDIIITEDLNRMQSVSKEITDRPVQVLAISDLITMKQRAGRPQDIEDIKALKKLL